MSTNTILMDCNREQAVGGKDSNSSLWTNEVSSGIRLDPGDTVSVHSAFINEIGSGADTIEFLGTYLDEKVYDNQVTVSVSYYKNADADNCLILPRNCCWDTIDATSDDGLPSNSNKPTTYDATFARLYRRKHDALRYTIYQQDTSTQTDIALNSYSRYLQPLTLGVDTGYNTPADISSRLTETLHASSEPDTLHSGGFPYSIVCDSTVYQRFDCANSGNFSKAKFTAKDATYKSAFTYIGVLRPDLFEAGRQLYADVSKVGATNKMQVHSYDAATYYLTLDYEYNNATVALWQALFDAQRDQFDSAELLLNGTTTRFIHVNHNQGTGWTQLGNDTNLSYMSVRQPIHNTAEGCIFNDGGRIQFRLQTPVFQAHVTTARFAGWDVHFSAFSNDCLMLWSGVAPSVKGSYTRTITGQEAVLAGGEGVDKIILKYYVDNSVYTDGATKKLDELFDYVYLGAINPLISFDESESRFYLSGLHTPRKLRNDAFAGSEPSNPLNPDAGKDIYQINPEYFENTSTTVYNPEQRALQKNELTADEAAKTDILTLNLLRYFTVFDASSGIFIEDWGVPEEHWDASLWGKLGFSYEQMHGRGHRQDRATNTSVVMSPASTNADVNSTQTMGWCVNIYGAPQYLSQLPVMGTSHENETTEYAEKDGVTPDPKVQNRYIFRLGTITQDATSTRITAMNLPVKQTSSYWTIRSSLIDHSRYFSSHGLMPVIAVVDKSYSGSDFYFMSDSNVRFTITKPKVLTAITTSVHLPDGSLARTDGSSAVIYQITKGTALTQPANK
eukprot:COSAG02_NODE_2621_length_8402_cov_12.631218_7_plen_788_part_00